MPRSPRKRQMRLELTPLPSSSPASATYHKQVRDRAAAVGYQGSPNISKPGKLTDRLRSSARDHLPTPASSRVQHDAATSNDEESNDDELPRARGSKTSARKTSSPLTKVRATPSSSGKIFGTKGSRFTSSGRKTRATAALDDSSDEDMLPSSATMRRAADNLVDLGSDLEDSDSDLPVTPATRRAGSKRKAPVSVSSDDDEDEILPRRSQRKRSKRSPEDEHAEADEDEESVASQPPPSRKRRRIITVEEKQELADDLEFLKSSDDESVKPVKSSPVKSRHQQALEQLKARRARLGAGGDAQHAVPVDSDGESELEVLDDDDDSEDDLPPASSAVDMFNEDEDDEGFLTDAGDDTLGVPEAIPLAYTRYASMKAKDLFRFVVEWMVQKKLNPGFNDVDEVYDLAFRKLDDEVKGLAGSKFESAAWRPDFLFTLRARPQMEYTRVGADLLHDKCEACNRSGHIPTWTITFEGSPYHVETLEDVERDDDSDSDADSDAETAATNRDAHGRKILPETHTFHVGKFCMANARTAHQLTHWRHHLYQRVVDELGQHGHLNASKIVERDRWGEPKRRKFANRVLDEMVVHGEVKQLYHRFRDEVDTARDAKQARWDSSP